MFKRKRNEVATRQITSEEELRSITANNDSIELDIGMHQPTGVDTGVSKKKNKVVPVLLTFCILALLITVGYVVSSSMNKRELAPAPDTSTTKVVDVSVSKGETNTDSTNQKKDDLNGVTQSEDNDIGKTDVVSSDKVNSDGSTQTVETTNQNGIKVPSMKAPKNYVAYVNNYLNIQYVYPSNWVLSEQSNLGLDTIKSIAVKNIVDLRTQALPKAVPSSIITSPESKDTTITVSVHPTGESAKNGIIVLDTIKGTVSQSASSNVTLGTRIAQTSTYQTDEYGLVTKGYQVAFTEGKNKFVINLLDKDTKNFNANVTVVNEIAKSLVIF